MGPRGPEGPSCTWLADVEVSGEAVGAKGGEPEAGGGGQGGKGKGGKGGGGGGAEEEAEEEPGRKDEPSGTIARTIARSALCDSSSFFNTNSVL